MAIVREALFQVAHALWAGGADHCVAVGALDPEPGRVPDVLTQFVQILFRKALGHVDGEHAAPGSAAE